ncbi:unnamed protein product [Ceutorhynchus assimilis]|uniref:C2H2-type domain-containing protein n=1 Tax=Ceutorhynchus assimilis TaxID=467358 RepID=A0A9N9QDR3_9CUCU|nr:unnamed protein product [Ceutorhynchus assimilis]
MNKNPPNWLDNISDTQIPDEVANVLSYGPNFCLNITQEKKLPITEYITSIETAIKDKDNETKDSIRDLRDAGPSNDRNQQFSLDFSDNLSQTSPASRSILEKDKQFFCSSCEKWFKSLRGLNIHKSKSHHSFQKQRQVNDNISSANSQQKSSLKNKSVEIQCNFCNKRFKTQKGINQHVTIKHVNASTNNTNEHNILDSFSINSLLTKMKSSTSVIKRIPKGARTCKSESEELASVLNTCVKENSLKSWFHLLIFSYIVLKVPDERNANRNKSLTSLVKENLAIWQNLTTLPLDQLNDYLRRNNKPPQIKKVNHPQKDNQLSKKIEGKIAEGDIKGAIRDNSATETEISRNVSNNNDNVNVGASTSVGIGCLSDESVVCWEADKDIPFTEKSHDVDDHSHEKEEKEGGKKDKKEEAAEKGMDVEALTTFQSPEKDDVICLVSDDPGKWLINLTHSQVQYIIENFPKQVQNIAFPRDKQNKKISESYFYRILSNGEKIHRPWLLYSLSLNSVFCAPCKLFCTDVTIKEKKEHIYGAGEVKDWQHLSLILKRHESSLSHIKYTKEMHDLSVVLKKFTTIDSSNQRLYELEKTEALENLKDYFVQIRCDEHFKILMDAAKQIASDVELEGEFPALAAKRIGKRKRHFDYEHEDESILDPEMSFKVNFYFEILDATIIAVNERFQLLYEHTNIFKILYNIHEYGDLRDNELKAHCAEAELALRDQFNCAN